MDDTIKVLRQGELLFIPVKLTENQHQNLSQEMVRLKGTNCIREGEATGHKHEIDGTALLYDVTRESMYLDGNYLRLDGEMFLDAPDPVSVIHPEHKTLKLDRGQYVIRIQKEYDEVKDRLVND